jgi:hypothetical protein
VLVRWLTEVMYENFRPWLVMLASFGADPDLEKGKLEEAKLSEPYLENASFDLK